MGLSPTILNLAVNGISQTISLSMDFPVRNSEDAYIMKQANKLKKITRKRLRRKLVNDQLSILGENTVYFGFVIYYTFV